VRVDLDKEAFAAHVAAALGELYSASRMPVLALRRNGEIVAANPSAVAKYGYSEAEFTAMRIHDLVTDGRNLDAEIARVLLDEATVLTRRPHRKKDGGIIYVLPCASRCSVRDAAGEPLLISFLQDVTLLDAAETRERLAREDAADLQAWTRALRAELLAADRLATIGRLAAGVAHEVNNPAALVLLNLGLLRDRALGSDARSEDARHLLDDSIEAMGRIRDIVNDIKGFAGERSRERVDLSRLAAGVVRMTQLEADGGANVDAMFEPEVFAKVRGSRLSQVLVNLLLNAAQAVPTDSPSAASGGAGKQSGAPAKATRPPKILLRTFRAGGQACIEVSDCGPGVPSQLAERIFEPFFTTRASSGGTGLGLWLARGIVEEEGGTLALSERPGGGAVFRVSLPAASSP
jgi:PAS domain S-box-containing protein